jgi:hypothetical protein
MAFFPPFVWALFGGVNEGHFLHEKSVSPLGGIPPQKTLNAVNRCAKLEYSSHHKECLCPMPTHRPPPAVVQQPEMKKEGWFFLLYQKINLGDTTTPFGCGWWAIHTLPPDKKRQCELPTGGLSRLSADS